MSTVHTPSTPSDFAEASFDDAVAWLKAEPSEVEIFCSYFYWQSAWPLKQKYGCQVNYVPDELLKSRDHWAVVSGSNVYWVPGA